MPNGTARDTDGARPLLIGATGRVGRLLLASGAFDAVPQARRPLAGHLLWDLQSAPPDLPPLSGIVMLAGGVGDADAYEPLALTAARLGADLGVPVLIASTQAVYGPTPGPHAETGPCHPKGTYGEAKLAMEQAVAGFDHVTCLRIGNVAGADMLFRSMASGPVRLDEVTPGRGPLRNLIGPVTLAHWLTAVLARLERPRIVNLAQPGLIDMADLLRAARADWSWHPAPPGVLPRVELDLTRAQSLAPLPMATAQGLVDEARACGWSLA